MRIRGAVNLDQNNDDANKTFAKGLDKHQGIVACCA
jgi:hypothetical protein